jgi:hypothetical protein
MESWLLLSAAYWNQISYVLFAIYNCIKITEKCYHLLNGIRYGLAQSDPIKRRLLYYMLSRNGNNDNSRSWDK